MSRRYNFDLKKIIGLFIYKLVIEIAYAFFLSPLFDYSNFKYDFNLSRYLLSWVIFVLFGMFVLYTNANSCRKTDIIMEIYLYLSITPSIILFEAGTVKGLYFFLDIFFWLLLFLFYILLGKIELKIAFHIENRYGNFIIIAVALASVLVVLYICVKYSGFRLSFDLYNVYGLRKEAGDYGVSSAIGYLLGLSCAVVPVIIVFSLKKKKYLMGFLLIFIQLLNFSINGLKSTFAMTLLSIACYFFIRKSYLKNLEIIFSVFGLACIIEKACFKTFYLIDFLLRRVFFVSSQLSFCYMDYFLHNEPDYFKTTILGRLFGIPSSYSSIAYMIGDIYFHKDTSANCGLVADAMTNMGVAGLFVLPFVLSIFFLILDKCVKNINEKIYFVAFVYIAYVLNNAFFTTAMLSHGIFGLMIVMWILSKMEEKRQGKEG